MLTALPLISQIAAPYLLIATFLLCGDVLPSTLGTPSIFEGSGPLLAVGVYLLIAFGNIAYAIVLPKLGFTDRQLLFWSFCMKVSVVPLYIALFLVSLLLFIFIIPVVLISIAFAFLAMLVSSAYGIVGIVKSWREQHLRTGEAVLAGISLFVLWFDMAGALYCYLRVRCDAPQAAPRTA